MNTLATIPDSNRGLVDALSVAEVLRHKQLIAEVSEQVMKLDTHYGASFPGDKKRNLLKPGADALMVAFQLVPRFTVDERSFDHNHREYRVTCVISTRAGQVVAEGVGTCSTLETKYRYRNAKPACPKCHAETLMRSKFEPGWYCNPKAGGCGANLPADAVTGNVGKVENPDPADCWNTCLKIAKKRAQVDATITATGCSDMFTQDAEDLGGKADTEEAKHPAAAPRAEEHTPAQGNPVGKTEPARGGDASQQQSSQETSSKKAPPSTPSAASGSSHPSPGATTNKTPVSDAGNNAKGACEEIYRLLVDVGGKDFAMAVWHSAEHGWPARHALLTQALDALNTCDQKLGDAVSMKLTGAVITQGGYDRNVWQTDRPKPSDDQKAKVRAIVAQLVHTANTGEVPQPATVAASDDADLAPF